MAKILQILGYRRETEVRIEVDASLRHLDERWLVWWVHPILPRLRATVSDC